MSVGFLIMAHPAGFCDFSSQRQDTVGEAFGLVRREITNNGG